MFDDHIYCLASPYHLLLGGTSNFPQYLDQVSAADRGHRSFTGSRSSTGAACLIQWHWLLVSTAIKRVEMRTP